MVFVLYKEDLASGRLEVLVWDHAWKELSVWAHALKIYIILFSGARVVIAHKQDFVLSLNKSIYEYPDVRNVENWQELFFQKTASCKL